MTFIILGETYSKVSSNIPGELVTPEKGLTYDFEHDDQIDNDFLSFNQDTRIFFICMFWIFVPPWIACL